MKQQIKDIKSIVICNYKLLFSSKMIVFVFFLSIMMSYALLQSFSSHIQEKSSIPIGIADKDHSLESEKFIKQLKNLSILYIYEEDEKDLKEKLKENLICSYFVVKQGFSTKIKAGEEKSLIEVHTDKKKAISVMLSDIVAGELVYDLSLSKTLKMYLDLERQVPNPALQERFFSYMEQLKNEKQFEFAFDIQMMQPKGGRMEKGTIDNTLIYQQVIISMIGILLGLVALYVAWGIFHENTIGLQQRKNITSFHKSICVIGNFFSIYSVLLMFCVASSYFIYQILQKNKEISYLAIFKEEMILVLYFCCIFYLLGSIIKKSMSYQMIGAFIVMGTAGLSLAGYFVDTMVKFVQWMPNYRFIHNMTQMIL